MRRDGLMSFSSLLPLAIYNLAQGDRQAPVGMSAEHRTNIAQTSHKHRKAII
jgi:hypothetical protein